MAHFIDRENVSSVSTQPLQVSQYTLRVVFVIVSRVFTQASPAAPVVIRYCRVRVTFPLDDIFWLSVSCCHLHSPPVLKQPDCPSPLQVKSRYLLQVNLRQLPEAMPTVRLCLCRGSESFACLPSVYQVTLCVCVFCFTLLIASTE